MAASVTATRHTMMRRRSSARCSTTVIRAPSSRLGTAATSWDQPAVGRRRAPRWRHRPRDRWRPAALLLLLLLFIDLAEHVVDVAAHAGLEPLDLPPGLGGLAGHPGDLLGPEHQQGDD